MNYKYVMFDWGNTVMKDNPLLTTPMYQWPEVEIIDGIKDTMEEIAKKFKIVMATSAQISSEAEIRLALHRVGIDRYFSKIFCYENIGIPKTTEKYYQFIISRLNAQPSELVMIGDSFEADVKLANRVGIFGIWFNAEDEEDRQGELYRTIHNMNELIQIFR
jgi:putative hydrolase of the HAD superfamily